MRNPIIPTVNLHLTKACNMKCKYCFAGFNEVTSEINYCEKKKLLSLLWKEGFKKINFVGGEPMLIKQLPELIKIAKTFGFYTSIVTNGSLISESFLKTTSQFLDQVGLSIDSLNETTNRNIGRNCVEIIPDFEYYQSLINKMYAYGLSIKINTVISQLNLNETFDKVINMPAIERWKVFQVLAIENENGYDFDKFKISQKDFEDFCSENKNKLINPDIMICENNNAIKGSYLMINPQGQFFDNSKGFYSVSEKIIDVGVKQALSQINYDYSKFINRKGDYYLKRKLTKQAS